MFISLNCRAYELRYHSFSVLSSWCDGWGTGEGWGDGGVDAGWAVAVVLDDVVEDAAHVDADFCMFGDFVVGGDDGLGFDTVGHG